MGAQVLYKEKPSFLLAPQTVVNNDYVVLDCLGAGSSAAVYRAFRRDNPRRTLVLKVLHPFTASDRVALARFQREILASYRVDHPNIVEIIEYIDTGSLVACSMEYVGGGDLRELLTKESPLPLLRAVRLIAECCSALEALHEAGIVHRDLKPENVLLTRGGQAKITDFGVARLKSGRPLTEYGNILGAVDYVSPEYVLAGKVDERSDIYALGLIAYELITGKYPYSHGNNVVESLSQRITKDPLSPQELRKDCPAELSAFVMKAIERNPQKRFQSAQEMMAALVRSSAALAHSAVIPLGLETAGPGDEPGRQSAQKTSGSPVGLFGRGEPFGQNSRQRKCALPDLQILVLAVSALMIGLFLLCDFQVINAEELSHHVLRRSARFLLAIAPAWL